LQPDTTQQPAPTGGPSHWFAMKVQSMVLKRGAHNVI
jgi:hypothetical protein